MTLQVRGSDYTMPHVPHLLGIIALALVIHPLAGAAWTVVYGIHAAGNLGTGGGYWTCTQCGAQMKDGSVAHYAGNRN